MGRTALVVPAVVVTLLTGATQLAAETTAFFLIDGNLCRFQVGQSGSTFVGPTGYEPTSLAFSPSGELYGVDPWADQLLVIDEVSGAGTVVGNLGVDVAVVESDITFDEAGMLWMSSGYGIYRVDVLTGSATFMFEADPGVPFAEGWWGLAFADGVLYGDCCSMYTIDTVTGATNLVWTDDMCVTMGMAGVGSSNVWRINRSCLPTFCYYYLAGWDTATGEPLGNYLIAANDLFTKGVAVRDIAAPQIPTLGRVGLFLLVLTICASGAWLVPVRGAG